MASGIYASVRGGTNNAAEARICVVPVKVRTENGAISPGDLLTTSSSPGKAMNAGMNPPSCTIIGKALGSLESGEGVIQMLVTLQ